MSRKDSRIDEAFTTEHRTACGDDVEARGEKRREEKSGEKETRRRRRHTVGELLAAHEVELHHALAELLAARHGVRVVRALLLEAVVLLLGALVLPARAQHTLAINDQSMSDHITSLTTEH